MKNRKIRLLGPSIKLRIWRTPINDLYAKPGTYVKGNVKAFGRTLNTLRTQLNMGQYESLQRLERMRELVRFERKALRHVTVPGFETIHGELRHLKSGIVVKTQVNTHPNDSYRGFVHRHDAYRALLDRLRILLSEERRRRRIMAPVRTSNGYGGYYYLTGGVHTVAGEFQVAKNTLKRSRIRKSKKPQNAVKHIGVEIEFFCPHDSDAVSDALIDAGIDQYVQVKEDGSINPDGNNCGCGDCDECESGSDQYGHEICVLVSEKDHAKVIRKVCSVLAALGAQVNESCGLHVHLDMRSRDVRRAYRNLVNAMPVLATMVPKARRNNSYCETSLRHDFDSQCDRGGRYWAVNTTAYDEHTTLEVRLHSGTTNATKIINWIGVLVRVANATKLLVPVETMTGLATFVRMPKRLRAWATMRIAKFAGNKHTGWLTEDAA